MKISNCKNISKSNLKQLDICTSFQRWKSVKKENVIFKDKLSSTIIEIDDSDSEVVQINHSIEMFPRKKRPLKCPFSDNEDDETDKTSESPPKQPKNGNKSVTFPQVPLACSTPLPTCNSSTSDDSYIYIRKISHVNSEILNDESFTSDTNSNDTIIIEQNAPNQNNKTAVNITEHIILLPGARNNETFHNVTDTDALNKSQSLESGNKKIRKQNHINKNKDMSKQCAVKLRKIDSAVSMNSTVYQKESVSNKENDESLSTKKLESSKDNQYKSVNETNTSNLSPSKPNKNSTSKANSKGTMSVKKEEKKMNTNQLQLLIDLFLSIFNSMHVNSLLVNERIIIKAFLDMDIIYQYVCLKLITWKNQWYNVFKFCQRINVTMEETDIYKMYSVLEQKGIIDTNYVDSDDILHLLYHLDVSDLKIICKNFKLKSTLTRKEEMVSNLFKYCKTQSTLSTHKSSKDLLLEEIKHRMGKSMRVNEQFKNAFYTTYLLGTFTNTMFSEITDYFKSFLLHKVEFPQYRVDDYTVFSSRSEFISYTKAKMYRDEVVKIQDHLERLQICRTVFNELKSIEKSRTQEELFKDAPHLIRYTARAVHASTLSYGVKHLFAKFPNDCKLWLEYMIEKINFPRKIGFWYYHLIWLYMRYLTPLTYDHAAQLLIQVLRDKRQHLSDIQLHTLRKLGKKLMMSKKYKTTQLNHDTIAQFLPKHINVHKFPEIRIDASAMRSNLNRKRDYIIKGNDGSKTVLSVEQIALKHYIEELNYSGGQHCEGALIKATFTLFFFDIIYNSKNCIPGTFISKIQSEPLDMNTEYFYLNRKEEIDKRLKEIESDWSDAKVISFLKENYEKHSHEYTLCEVGVIITDPEFLEVLVACIGRTVLAKIYERLVKNFREFRSGLPDLFIWNIDSKECKFVEVKGENDTLSIGQILWLHYLQSIGAQIEVCLVHSIGSKRKIKKVDKSSNVSEKC